jgi:hypothetical protein
LLHRFRETKLTLTANNVHCFSKLLTYLALMSQRMELGHFLKKLPKFKIPQGLSIKLLFKHLLILQDFIEIIFLVLLRLLIRCYNHYEEKITELS